MSWGEPRGPVAPSTALPFELDWEPIIAELHATSEFLADMAASMAERARQLRASLPLRAIEDVVPGPLLSGEPRA